MGAAVRVGPLVRHRRRQVARRKERARAGGGGVPRNPGGVVYAPPVGPGMGHVFHQDVVRSASRDALASFLKARGVPTTIHYPQPVHRQPAYQGRVEMGGSDLQESERASREVLSLPMHAYLTDEAVQTAAQQVANFEG